MTSTVEEKSERIARWIEQGDEAAISHLSQILLYDGDAALRASASEALGRIPMTPITRAAAVQALTKALVDEDGPVRLKAVHALGKIGGDAAAGSLALVLQDRETSGLMLAAEAQAGADHQVAATGKAIERLRNEAWDIQYAAAEALGRIGGPETLSVLAGWSERLLLSDVRVMSGEEKIEIVRAIMTSIFTKLEAGHIHAMAQLLRQTVSVLAHDEIEKGNGRFGWVTLHCQNPVFSLFKEEISRRKMEYMASLDNRDTLFNSSGRGTEAESREANAKDTLFNPINPGEAANGASQRIQTSREQIESEKSDMLKSLNDKDALLLARHMSSGPSGMPQPAKKPATLSEAERQRRLAEYAKTLGVQDSLFMPSHLKPESMTGGAKDESAFGEEDAPATPAATPGERAAAHAASLGPADTLWRPAVPQTAAPAPDSGDGDDDLFGDDDAPVAPQSAAAPPRQVRVASPPPVQVPPRPVISARPGAPKRVRPGLLRRMWNAVVEFLRP